MAGASRQGYCIWITANWDRILMRSSSSQPARLSLPRIESVLGSSLARFRPSLLSTTVADYRVK